MKQYDSMVFWPVENELNEFTVKLVSESVETVFYSHNLYPAYLATPTSMAECFVTLYED